MQLGSAIKTDFKFSKKYTVLLSHMLFYVI